MRQKYKVAGPDKSLGKESLNEMNRDCQGGRRTGVFRPRREACAQQLLTFQKEWKVSIGGHW